MKKRALAFILSLAVLCQVGIVYADELSEFEDLSVQSEQAEVSSDTIAEEDGEFDIADSEILSDKSNNDVELSVDEAETEFATFEEEQETITSEVKSSDTSVTDDEAGLYASEVSVSAVSFEVKGTFGGRNVTFNTASENAKIYYSATTSNLTTDDAVVNNGETVLFENFYGTIYARAYEDGKWGNVSRLILKIPVVKDPTITIDGDEAVISTQTPKCYICYTTDGSEPTIDNGKKVAGSKAVVKISGNTTIKAVAVRSCFTNSNVVSKFVPLSAPAFVVKGIFGGRKVTFTCNNSNAKIYYSTKTSALTTSDECIKSGESIDFSNYYGTLYAKAYIDGKWSNVSRLILKIPVVNKPTITKSNSNVVIKSTTPNSLICYTTDGSEPSVTNGNKVNSSTVTISPQSGELIRAIAVRNCFTNSDEEQYLYVNYPTSQFVAGNIAGTNAMSEYISTARWSSTSEDFVSINGDEMIVINANDTRKVVNVDIYDLYSRRLKSSNEINMELSIFGGYYCGENNIYMVFGQGNMSEDDDKEVFRVVKYDKSFNRLSSLSVTGKECYTVYPFDAGSLSMAESGNELTVHTSRLRYAEDGVNHQSQVTFLIDTDSMTLKEEVEPYQDNHVSHSFNQRVQYDDGVQVLVDHGDAYPRSIVLNKRNESGDRWDKYDELELFTIPGAIGANCTGVTLGGFEVSDNNYLVAINSIDHSKVTEYTSYTMSGLDRDERDVILLVSAKDNKDTEDVKQIKLTDYVNRNMLASTPYLVKLPDNKFAVLWEEFKYYSSYDVTDNGLKYVIVDENGNKLTDVKSISGINLASDCQPVYTNGYIVWFVNTSSSRYFYSIDLS